MAMRSHCWIVAHEAGRSSAIFRTDSPIFALLLLERLLTNCINSICFDTIDLVFAQPLDVVGFDPCRRFRPHLVDCPTEPRSEGNGPPIFGRAQALKPFFRSDLSIHHAPIAEQFPYRLDVRNPIPGSEGAMEIGTFLLDRC